MKFYLLATEYAPHLQKCTYYYYFSIPICVQDCELFPGEILVGLVTVIKSVYKLFIPRYCN
jgi:hypothetical protein